MRSSFFNTPRGLNCARRSGVLALFTAIGTIAAAPAPAQESSFRLRTESSKETFAAPALQPGGHGAGESEAPVMPARANRERAQETKTSVSFFEMKRGPEDLILLQDPGPAPSLKPAEAPVTNRVAASVNPITGLGSVSSNGYKPLSGKQRRELYLSQNITSVGAYFGPILTSLIDHAKGQPTEWGGGIKGYGSRLGSRLGTGFIQGSAQSIGCAVLGQDPRYIRSSSDRIFSRIGHAFLFSLITYNNEGKKRIALGTLGSYYAGAFASNLWLPERYTMLGDGVRDGNKQAIIGVLVNQFQEFAPDIKRLFRRRP